MEPTPAQLNACQLAKLNPENATWHGNVMVLSYWGFPEGGYALISEHGSITYCQPEMIDAHLGGIPK